MFFKKKKPAQDTALPTPSVGGSLFAPGLNPLPTRPDLGPSAATAPPPAPVREEAKLSPPAAPAASPEAVDAWQAWETGEGFAPATGPLPESGAPEIAGPESALWEANPGISGESEAGRNGIQSPASTRDKAEVADSREILPDGVYLAPEEPSPTAASADTADWAAFLADFSAPSSEDASSGPSGSALSEASPASSPPSETAWPEFSSTGAALPESGFERSEPVHPEPAPSFRESGPTEAEMSEFALLESVLPDSAWSELALPELPPSEPLSVPPGSLLSESPAEPDDSLGWFIDEEAAAAIGREFQETSEATTPEAADLSHFTENGGTFLDAVNERLYPDDPFHSEAAPDEPPAETAFEEAARYLFPETMQSPLDWSEVLAVPPSPAGQSHLGVHWPDEVFNADSLELGPSYQTGPDGLTELSADDFRAEAEPEQTVSFGWAEELSEARFQEFSQDAGEAEAAVASISNAEESPDGFAADGFSDDDFQSGGFPPESPAPSGSADADREAAAYAEFVADFRAALHVDPALDEAAFLEGNTPPDETVPDAGVQLSPEMPFPPDSTLMTQVGEVFPSDAPLAQPPDRPAETSGPPTAATPWDEPVWEFSMEESTFGEAVPAMPDEPESVAGPPPAEETGLSPGMEPSPALPEIAPVVAAAGIAVARPEPPSKPPVPVAPAAPVAKLGRLDILSVCPLDVDTRLMVVHNGEVHALMAQSGLEEQPRITVLKIFDRNPLAYQSTFAAVPDTRSEYEGLYMVQVGVLHGVLSLSKNRIAWHRDLG
jgi:hypothetical protein